MQNEESVLLWDLYISRLLVLRQRNRARNGHITKIYAVRIVMGTLIGKLIFARPRKR
jgi:hypothetical protein